MYKHIYCVLMSRFSHALALLAEFIAFCGIQANELLCYANCLQSENDIPALHELAQSAHFYIYVSVLSSERSNM